MSFYTIKDHKKRDETIKKYLATMERIKKQNMNDRLEKLGFQTEINEIWKPVIDSNKEAATHITKELIPIQDELQNLNETIRNRDRSRIRLNTPNRQLPAIPDSTPPSTTTTTKTIRSKSFTEGTTTTPTSAKHEKYGLIAAQHLKETLNNTNDNIFGIYTKKGIMMMGDKNIRVKGNHIQVDDELYNGTVGLWKLLTEAKPQGYTDNDLESYKQMIIQTHAMFQNNDPSSKRPKASKSYKWNELISPIWEEYKGRTKEGSGIIKTTFLPKNVKGLFQKLKILYAEFLAGNKTTQNELVAVLDELKRQNGISDVEYNNMNSLLQ